MRLEIRPKKRRARGGKVILVVTFVLVFVILAALLWPWKRMTALVREVAQSEIESIAFDIITKTVENELVSGGEEYADLVKIERDANGRVSSITTDTQKLNLLKLRILNSLSQKMFERSEDCVYIPLGNLTGIDFLTGMGPKVKLRVFWVSSVNGEFSNSFTDAGINQTNHRIMLDFVINSGMMFIGREVGVDVGVSVCVAETVIVGEIPKYFSDK